MSDEQMNFDKKVENEHFCVCVPYDEYGIGE